MALPVIFRSVCTDSKGWCDLFPLKNLVWVKLRDYEISRSNPIVIGFARSLTHNKFSSGNKTQTQINNPYASGGVLVKESRQSV